MPPLSEVSVSSKCSLHRAPVFEHGQTAQAQQANRRRFGEKDARGRCPRYAGRYVNRQDLGRRVEVRVGFALLITPVAQTRIGWLRLFGPFLQGQFKAMIIIYPPSDLCKQMEQN